MFRISLPCRLAAVALVVALVGPGAAQEQSPGPDAVSIHRARGLLAWQEAVWTGSTDRTVQAIEELTTARHHEPADVTTEFFLGLAHTMADQTEGVTVLTDFEKRARTYPGLLLARGIHLKNQERNAAALEALDEFLESADSVRRDESMGDELVYLAWYHKGWVQNELGKSQEAVGSLGEAVRISVEARGRPSVPAQSLLAQVHVRLQEYEVGERLLLELLRADPRHPGLYYSLGLIAADQGDFERARRLYRDSIARDPSYPEPYLKLAYLAKDRGDLRDLRASLETFSAIHEARARQLGTAVKSSLLADFASGMGEYWRIIGRRRDDAGDDEGARRAYERATEEFRRALERSPTCVMALNSLVQVLSRLGRQDAEIAPLKERLRRLQQDRSAEDQVRSTFC